MMPTIYRYLFPAMWLCWLAYWWLASRRAKSTDRREPWSSRLLHVLPLLLGIWLLWAQRVPGSFLNERMFPWAPWEFWVGAFVTATGLLFTVWARVHLAGNWSAMVTIKHAHELVATGPYGLVRHPIYTGLLLAFVGSALARGEWRGALAVVVCWMALLRKMRLEEQWMTECFGERYLAYAGRVPALVPRVRRSRS